MRRARSCKYLRSTSASERTIIGLMNAPIDPREISSVDDGLRSAREGGRSGPGTFCYSPRILGTRHACLMGKEVNSKRGSSRDDSWLDAVKCPRARSDWKSVRGNRSGHVGSAMIPASRHRISCTVGTIPGLGARFRKGDSSAADWSPKSTAMFSRPGPSCLEGPDVILAKLFEGRASRSAVNDASPFIFAAKTHFN